MKGGTIRRIAGMVKNVFSRNKVHSHPDPVLGENSRGMPHSKKPRARRGRKSDTRPMMRRGNLGPPKCEPGTLTYHDKLVRHFGSRQALKYRKVLIAGQVDLLPTKQDFLDNQPWAHLRSGAG